MQKFILLFSDSDVYQPEQSPEGLETNCEGLSSFGIECKN